jgi:hypothetical protein
MQTVELGCIGHFICAHLCRFRRHTQLGDKYRVSTIGAWMDEQGIMQTLGGGPDSYYETAVFRTTNKKHADCDCNILRSRIELEMHRYPDARSAQAGHEAMVTKYLEPAEYEPSQQEIDDQERFWERL